METRKLLFALLRIAVCGEQPTEEIKNACTEQALEAVFQLARKHDLPHLVGQAASKLQLPQSKWLTLGNQAAKQACIRYVRQSVDYYNVCAALEEGQIPFIPLKGSVLKDYYPEPWMRTSCDIDILVREEDLDRAVAVLEQKQFQVGERNFHDVSLFAPNGIHLELHFSICEKMDRLDAVLKNALNYAALEQGSRYAFQDAFFLFHQFSHMAYHFQSGGCGIRSLMDIWVMEHQMNLSYSCAEKLLRKAGIYQFAVEMTKLANRCFSERNVSDPVLDYIWRGGVYGIKQNEVMVKKSQSGGFLVYLQKRILKPYSSMIIIYPVLNKFPLLLPFCWVHRWIKAIILGKTRNVMSEFAFSHQISDAEAQQIEAILHRLGL